MKELRDLKYLEHELIGDIIGDSFCDDPVNQWIFGDKQCITEYYTKVAKKLYLSQGYGQVMVDKSGGTLWLRPGTDKNIPIFKALDIAASMVRHNGFRALNRGMSVDNALSNYHPKSPHYYLFAIGVRPDQQGKGIGGLLMKEGLKQADREQMPSYLESSKESNVPFYQRFGFEVTEKLVPTKGCPPLWLMWRKPKKPNQ